MIKPEIKLQTPPSRLLGVSRLGYIAIGKKMDTSIHRRVVSSLVQGPREKPYPGVLPLDYHTTEAKQYRMFCNDHKNSDLWYDKYDDYGRNISKQRRRQELVPWVKVSYGKGYNRSRKATPFVSDE